MDDSQPTELDVADILTLLAQGELEVQGMLPWSSNYTLLATVQCRACRKLSGRGRQGRLATLRCPYLTDVSGPKPLRGW